MRVPKKTGFISKKKNGVDFRRLLVDGIQLEPACIVFRIEKTAPHVSHLFITLLGTTYIGPVATRGGVSINEALRRNMNWCDIVSISYDPWHNVKTQSDFRSHSQLFPK